MSDDCPNLPRTPFRYDAIDNLGLTRYRLKRLVRDGAVRLVVRGVYVDSDVVDTMDLRIQAVALVTPATHVVRDRTAAWLHGIDVLSYAEHDVPPPVETCALRGHEPSTHGGVAGRTRDLAAIDIVRIGDLQVTTPLRTALDLGCVLRRREAMAALDAFSRKHSITRAELASEAARFRRRRGVIQLRELIALVDARAESARESWMRLAIRDAGLPAPTPQHWVEVDGRPTYRLDLAYPRHRIAVEYDGWEAHRLTPEQKARDSARRGWLRDNGWTVIVVREGDFTGDRLVRWLGELDTALHSSYSNVRDMERGSRRRY